MGVWEVEGSGAAVTELEDSLNQGPILDDQGHRFLVEREVDRIASNKGYAWHAGRIHQPPR